MASLRKLQAHILVGPWRKVLNQKSKIIKRSKNWLIIFATPSSIPTALYGVPLKSVQVKRRKSDPRIHTKQHEAKPLFRAVSCEFVDRLAIASVAYRLCRAWQKRFFSSACRIQHNGASPPRCVFPINRQIALIT
jgi:hypothetical protein